MNIFVYKSFFSYHPDGSAHAGSSLYIKSNLTHHPLPSYISPFIQASSVSFTHNNICFTIFSIYYPPGQIITYQHFSDFFVTLGHRFISGSDFNTKNPFQGNRASNNKDRTLFRCINYSNLSIFATLKPTYWPSLNNRLLDILAIFIDKLPGNYLTNVA